MYSVCWPDLWDVMARRVPGAATAGRYCRSPLYAFSAVADRPEGETWQHLIRLALEKWPEDIASHIANRIKLFIEAHNRDTNGAPIPDDPSLVSGVGWKFLYTIAVRGDLKNRRTRKLQSKEDPRDVLAADDDAGELGRL
jgi:predicted phosphoadenosine phosphosulfate sulfurtransferase